MNRDDRFHFSRRVFLQGAGVAMALPLLESLAPRRAYGAPMSPVRFLAYYIPCGIVMKNWTPAVEGPGYALTPILQPLAALKDQLLVVTGLANRPAKPDGPGDHASGTGAFLTAAHPKKTDGADIKNGVSVDQVMAAAVGQKSKFPSLQIGMDGGDSVGGCDSGYSCAYARNVSWADVATPLPKVVNPQTVFDRMFDSASLDPKVAAKRRFYKKSVLDYVIEDAKRLQAKLARTDSHKLDEYQTGVRDLETRIDNGAMANACNAPMRPMDATQFPNQVQIMSDLMVLAMQCDMTRVITFMFGNAGSGRPYPFLKTSAGLPISDGHHALSHHMGDPLKLDALTVIDTFEVQQLAYLLGKMAKVDDGNGKTLLDNSIVFFSGEIEDGNSHSHLNMPVLLAGKGGGAVKPGRHLVYKTERSFGDLFVTFLNALGVKTTTFGDNGTAPLTELSG